MHRITFACTEGDILCMCMEWKEKKTQGWKYKSSNFHIKQCLGVRRSGDIVFNGLVQAFCFTLLKISKFIQVKSKTSFVKQKTEVSWPTK